MKLKLRFISLLLVLFVALCLQGCSWRHLFQIRNSTEDTWEISYSINDPRGFFQTTVAIGKSKDIKELTFEGSNVAFSLAPGETAQIGMASNSHYKVYRDYQEFDPDTPWKTFINMGKITLTNGKQFYSLNANELSSFLSKNSRGVARLDLKKLVESS